MLYAIVTVLVLILDQGLKYWTSLKIALDTGTRELIPGLIHLTNIHNTGAAFSILENARWFFIVLTVIFVIAVIVLLAIPVIKGKAGRWMAVLVMAGAVGNCIDRIFLGYVVDMFEFEFMNFPVFNIADIFITVGGVAFCLYVIFHKDLDEEGLTAAEAAERDKVRRMNAKTVEKQRVANIDEISKDTGRFQAVRQTAEVAEVARTAEDARASRAHKHAAATRPADTAPAKRPAPRPAPVPNPEKRAVPVRFDPTDPFAEWEAAPAEAPQVSTGAVKDPADFAPQAPEPVQRQQPAAPRYAPKTDYSQPAKYVPPAQRQQPAVPVPAAPVREAPKYEPAVKYAAPAQRPEPAVRYAPPAETPAQRPEPAVRYTAPAADYSQPAKYVPPAQRQQPAAPVPNAPKYAPAPVEEEPAPVPEKAGEDMDFSLEDILAEFK